MAYHILRYINRNKLLTIVHGKGVTHKLRRNHGSTAPGFDYLFFAAIIELIHFALKFVMYKRSFF